MSEQHSDGPGSAEYKVAEVYQGLRQALFGVDPATVGLSRAECGEVWGLLMETGYPEAVATLVAIADGTVSLYFSNGGGQLGLGALDGPRQASQALLEAAPRFLGLCEQTAGHPLPRCDHTRFYLLTFEGVFTAEAKEEDLGENRHPMSELFYHAQELIGQVRLAVESEGGGAGHSSGV